ncbi:MAG: amidohydrolase 2, partial [Hyphomicrobiales bacterium]|nr:amidohydrolase 2 [Hyphomicrobiales bacterium]
MTDRKNRYGLTAARTHRTIGRARRPSCTTIDVHCHIVVPQAAAHGGPHVDFSKIPLAHFANEETKLVNAVQDKDRAEIMYRDVSSRLRDMDAMGIDIQVVAPAPMQCYYSIDTKIAAQAHELANEGVAAYVDKHPDRFAGIGVVTLQDPERAAEELERAMTTYKLKGVQIITNVNGEELSDPKFWPFFAKAEALGAFIIIHPNGFTEGRRFTNFYFSNVIGNPLDTSIALHNLIFGGTLARFPNLKIMAVHGGGYLPAYSGRIDHAWGAREDTHAGLPLPPSHYLRQIYFDTVVFRSHQLEYLVDEFGADRILMGTDYPFDMGEYDPIGHIAGVRGMDDTTMRMLASEN